jgi:hypothetical protein
MSRVHVVSASAMVAARTPVATTTVFLSRVS